MDAVFKDDLYLNYTEFGEKVFFNATQIQGKVIAPFVNQKSERCIADFSGCSFGNSVYFDSSTFHKFICIRSAFKQPVSFNNSKYWFVDFIGTHFAYGCDFSHTRYTSGSIETFRIIKAELVKAGNRVESLYYQSQELSRYDAQITWRAQPLEKFMLLLNKLSSNHGINWGRGVVFTFCVSLLFYSVYVCTVPDSGIAFGWAGWQSFRVAMDYFFKNYFKFLSIFRDFTFIDGTNPNAISHAIDFLGRIFIAYGIYQTVQAFRKYGKS